MTTKTTKNPASLDEHIGDQPRDLNEWLDEIDRLRAQKPPLYYANGRLGSPSYDNGIDRLFERGMSPQEALMFWKRWRGVG